jgi:hypothetical protein
MVRVIDSPRDMQMYQIAVTGEKSMAQIGREQSPPISRAAVQSICQRVATQLGVDWNAPRKVFLCKKPDCETLFHGAGTYYGVKARYCDEHRWPWSTGSESDTPVEVDSVEV